jgi:SP family sugar:H+ symporter-like MFS transporter
MLADIAGSSTSEFWLGFQTWRWMFWIELVPASVFLIALLFIPESPRYLVVSGNRERAEAVLTRLYGAEAARQKTEEIDASLAADHHRPKLGDLLEKPGGKVRTIVWVGIGLAAFQQLVGINVVFYYGAVLWQAVGFSEADALLINVISGAVSIAACIVALSLIDRIGRKPLLWFGSIGMAITLALMAVAFSTSTEVDGQVTLSDNMGVLALISANLYVMIFNGSWGPVMWVMLGEMFPNQIRGSGLAVAGLSQWLTNFAITMTFPIFLASIGLVGAYGFYAISAVVSAFFVHKMVHETRGLELEEMEG